LECREVSCHVHWQGLAFKAFNSQRHLLFYFALRLCQAAPGGKQNLLDIILEGYDIDKWPTFQELGDLENGKN
jgi:hypothetical protein